MSAIPTFSVKRTKKDVLREVSQLVTAERSAEISRERARKRAERQEARKARWEVASGQLGSHAAARSLEMPDESHASEADQSSARVADTTVEGEHYAEGGETITYSDTSSTGDMAIFLSDAVFDGLIENPPFDTQE